MLPALLGLLPSIFTGVKEYVGKKQDLQKLERESEVRIKAAQVEAKIRRIESADKADSAIDEISVRNSGWMDDYLVLGTTIPLATLMLSPYVDLAVAMSAENFVYVKGMLAKAVGESFDEMVKLPDYYWYALGAVYVHALGMRRMVRMFIDRIGNPLKKGK